MSDIRCVVCGEPWDAYGVRHGDMAPWEADLFRKGAGCPCCKGETNGYAPERLSDVDNGDEDPMDRIVAAERVADGTKPPWIRPEDPTLWTCDACGVRVVRDLDTGELEHRGGAHFGREEPEETPAHTFTESDGIKVCAECLEHCSECGVHLCQELSSDTYDGFASFPDPRDEYHARVCVDCLSKVEEEEAQRVWRECYSTSERIEYVRRHSSQFDFRSFSDLLGCVRGRYFAGYASELLG